MTYAHKLIQVRAKCATSECKWSLMQRS